MGTCHSHQSRETSSDCTGWHRDRPLASHVTVRYTTAYSIQHAADTTIHWLLININQGGVDDHRVLAYAGHTASFCMQNEGDIKLNMEPPRCTFYIVLLSPTCSFFSSSLALYSSTLWWLTANSFGVCPPTHWLFFLYQTFSPYCLSCFRWRFHRVRARVLPPKCPDNRSCVQRRTSRVSQRVYMISIPSRSSIINRNSRRTSRSSVSFGSSASMSWKLVTGAESRRPRLVSYRGHWSISPLFDVPDTYSNQCDGKQPCNRCSAYNHPCLFREKKTTQAKVYSRG